MYSFCKYFIFLKGAIVNIAFAVVFVSLICFFETARHGVFSLSLPEITGVVYGALVLGAVVILRGDLISVIIRPKSTLYGTPRLIWTWPRTLFGVMLGPLLWVVPVLYGVVLLQITVLPDVSVARLAASFAPFLLIAIAESLFLREAVIKAFSPRLAHIYVVSTLAVFIFHVADGVPQALISAGAGVYFLTLRLIGANILAVALVHAASMVVFSEALNLGIEAAQIWTYAGYFVAASIALSIFIYSLFSIRKEAFSHA